MAVDALNGSPIKGQWLNLQTHCYTCSECGQRIYTATCPGQNFCANCGADMRESRAEWRKKEDDQREKDIQEGKLKPWP